MYTLIINQYTQLSLPSLTTAKHTDGSTILHGQGPGQQALLLLQIAKEVLHFERPAGHSGG